MTITQLYYVLAVAENKNFTSLINYTNRRINLLQKVCINRDNQIVYSEADE